MSNLEKISAYLEEQMSAAERAEFEKTLSNDPELRNELSMQQDIIEGVKEARRLELKSMLDNVPIGGAGIAGTITFGKLASTIAVIGLISVGIYYFTKDDPKPIAENNTETLSVTPEEELIEDKNQPVEKPKSEEKTTSTSASSEKGTETTVNTPTEEVTANTEVDNEVEINKPTAAPMFETAEADSLEAPTDDIVEKVDGSLSSIDVEIDNTRKKYSFHYKFNKGKMFLYGDFDKGLYEILEFKTTSKKTLFLHYKGKFYPLDKNQVRITELKAVKEQSLINKLKDVASIQE